jgi:hypothetical protein
MAEGAQIVGREPARAAQLCGLLLPGGGGHRVFLPIR